ncbi:TPA: hypothetical protein ACUNCG_002414 [Aeromonas hydrophila]
MDAPSVGRASSAGRLSHNSLPKTRRFAAALLILREWMHHLSAERVVLAAANLPKTRRFAAALLILREWMHHLSAERVVLAD